jgi:hypothetical protein
VNASDIGMMTSDAIISKRAIFGSSLRERLIK